MTANNCGTDMGGSKCSKDHSRLLHGSGNVYCGAVSADLTGSASEMFSCVKEDEVTLFYFQDIHVQHSAMPARVMWMVGATEYWYERTMLRKIVW